MHPAPKVMNAAARMATLATVAIMVVEEKNFFIVTTPFLRCAYFSLHRKDATQYIGSGFTCQQDRDCRGA
jgi:hypothetical protein